MASWKEVAVQNPILAAAELYFLARPDERVPWRHLLPPMDEEELSPPPEKWGRRKRRSRSNRTTGLAEIRKEAEEDKAGWRASPTTPLSWSAGPASSGSACDVGEMGSESRQSSAAKRPRHGAGGGSTKVEEVVVVARRRKTVVVMSEAGVTDSNIHGWLGKKMTATELKENERSLLEKNMLLRKELEEQKVAQRMLIDENKRLRTLESKLQHQVVAEMKTAHVTAEEPKHEERQCFPFDLNLPFPAESDGNYS